VAQPRGAPTRVSIRVGVFGSHDLSRQIHAQIANRLHNPSAAPATPATSATSTVPSAQPLPGTTVPVTTAPIETAPPPLAGAAEQIIPVAAPTQAGVPQPWQAGGQ
jgi:hypothetical protein